MSASYLQLAILRLSSREDMFPKLIEYNGIVVHSYGCLHAIAYFVGLWLATYVSRQRGIRSHQVYVLGLCTLLVALMASRLSVILTTWAMDSHRLNTLAYLRSTGGFYYGLIPGILFAIGYLKKNRLPVREFLDCFSPSVALGLAIGRLGCFSAGCCYGKPTQAAIGVIFTDPYAYRISGVPLSVSLHPTQLYEALTAFIVFLVLLLLKRRGIPGMVFGVMLILLSASRFTIEFFRGDSVRGFMIHPWLSVPQVVSVLLGLSGIILLRHLSKAESPRALG